MKYEIFKICIQTYLEHKRDIYSKSWILCTYVFTYMHTYIHTWMRRNIQNKKNNKHESVNGRKWILMICKHTSPSCTRIVQKNRKPSHDITSNIHIHFNAFSFLKNRVFIQRRNGNWAWEMKLNLHDEQIKGGITWNWKKKKVKIQIIRRFRNEIYINFFQRTIRKWFFHVVCMCVAIC